MGTTWTAATFDAKPALRVEAVELPGGDTAHVRELTGADLDRVRAKATDKKGAVDGVKLQRVMAAACVCDAAGERLLADNELHKIDDRPFAVIQALAEAAAELNGFKDDEDDGDPLDG